MHGLVGGSDYYNQSGVGGEGTVLEMEVPGYIEIHFGTTIIITPFEILLEERVQQGEQVLLSAPLYVHDPPGPPSPPLALSFRLDLETDTGTQSTSGAARIFHPPNPTGLHQPVT